jgi:hypothetical protein
MQQIPGEEGARLTQVIEGGDKLIMACLERIAGERH